MLARNLQFCSLALPLLFTPAGAEEQSSAKRTPPPVKYASPPEQKQHDWSGFHMGVSAGTGFGTNNRNSGLPGSSNSPR